MILRDLCCDFVICCCYYCYYYCYYYYYYCCSSSGHTRLIYESKRIDKGSGRGRTSVGNAFPIMMYLRITKREMEREILLGMLIIIKHINYLSSKFVDESILPSLYLIGGYYPASYSQTSFLSNRMEYLLHREPSLLPYPPYSLELLV